MTETEAILERHSVRTYENRKIEEDKMRLIEARIGQLNEEGDLHLQFIRDAGNTFNKLLNKAV